MIRYHKLIRFSVLLVVYNTTAPPTIPRLVATWPTQQEFPSKSSLSKVTKSCTQTAFTGRFNWSVRWDIPYSYHHSLRAIKSTECSIGRYISFANSVIDCLGICLIYQIAPVNVLWEWPALANISYSKDIYITSSVNPMLYFPKIGCLVPNTNCEFMSKQSTIRHNSV